MSRPTQPIDETTLLKVICYRRPTPYGWVLTTKYRCDPECVEEHIYASYPESSS